MTNRGAYQPITHQAWRLMCEREVFTRKEIANILKVKTNLVTELTKRLEKQQAIVFIKRQPGNQGNLYRVCIQPDAVILGTGKPQGKRAIQRIKRSTVVQQIWNSIRIHKSIDKYLIMTTSLASEASIVPYLGKLASSGYLRQLNTLKGSPRGTCLRFRLIRDTGRLHPIVQPKGMWDQNTQTFYPFKEQSDE